MTVQIKIMAKAYKFEKQKSTNEPHSIAHFFEAFGAGLSPFFSVFGASGFEAGLVVVGAGAGVFPVVTGFLVSAGLACGFSAGLAVVLAVVFPFVSGAFVSSCLCSSVCFDLSFETNLWYSSFNL